ncbi:D-serine ammonia-lyase [Insolitispirillum peregrinum]|uniref:Probable D-serine dehydratase n=2 Tax=Insolitispirillum peregrinum TaxID=80876 RepID=A0A1N7NEM1_9PROT|nr:D-serine ammonia-lyase [Insolitispirillum peregrinum]
MKGMATMTPVIADPALLTHPALAAAAARRETCWFNPQWQPLGKAQATLPVDATVIDGAEARLARCAPLMAAAFPLTAGQGGILESPLLPVPALHQHLERGWNRPLPGHLWLKADHALPVSGSIKARGGIHEVLKVAETVALRAGLWAGPEENTRRLLSPQCRAEFQRHEIAVGSTGNLGLSIGIMAARLGFSATVHMSADAKGWKKALLREKGVQVVEYAEDYSAAVAQGRQQAQANPLCHFVDDENSLDLFAGYAVAARRLAGQFAVNGIVVDADHPLFVYLPCGVGGGPGGVAFGLRQQFGDAVHCLFAEPVEAPCMLLGMASGRHHQVAVQDLGLSGQTCADGLAVGRASGFVGGVMEPLLSGIFTVSDAHLLQMVVALQQAEGLMVEPSAVAGVPGVGWVSAPQATGWRQAHGLTDQNLQRATHLVWSTGGSMVPVDEQERTLAAGQAYGPLEYWGFEGEQPNPFVRSKG